MKARTIITTGAALAVLATGVTSASAMPVRNIQVTPSYEGATISADAYSPPSGACGAYYAIGVYYDGTLLRKRVGRFNACQVWASDDSGWSMGTFRATFNVSNLPVGTYTVCVGAGNRNVGVGGIHAICRMRRI